MEEIVNMCLMTFDKSQYNVFAWLEYIYKNIDGGVNK